MTIYVSEFMQDIIFSDVMGKSDIGQIEVGTGFWQNYCDARTVVRSLKRQMTVLYETAEAHADVSQECVSEKEISLLNYCPDCKLNDMWCECEKPIEVTRG